MTHDQHIASDPGLSAWVSASAGTGKTKVLTDRVLRLLLAGAAPARILCITYTKAAAAEMESRISNQLANWVTLDDAALRTTLAELTGAAPNAKAMANARKLFAKVLDSPERMRIQTIHSLCQSILARFPLEAQVPVHFTLIDEIASRELLSEARASLFAHVNAPEHKTTAEAILSLGEHMSETALNELIAQIIRQHGKFLEWLSTSPDKGRIYKTLGLPLDMDAKKLCEKHLQYSDAQLGALRKACEILAQESGKTDSQMHDALRLWLGKRDDIRAYVCAYLTDKNTPRAQLFTKAAAKRWDGLEETLRAEQRRIQAYFTEWQTLFIAEASWHASVLAKDILSLFRTLKERHGYLDYDDLIFYTAKLLGQSNVAPWVLYKLDGGIDHLLIDEAQDTSPEQWRIVDALAAEFFAGDSARSLKRTLFVVGDEKQSIFSFQGAEPHAFDGMQRRLSKMALDSGADFRRVRLALSFRSTAPVLSAVDAAFATVEARDGLIFTETDIRHDVHRSGMAGRVELWPLIESVEEEGFPVWHIPDAHSFTERPDLLCAKQIAETIAGWLKQKRMLVSQGRPILPGDIMILVQRRNAFAASVLRELKRLQVPVAGADRLVLTDHIAVEDCVALAHFLLLPQDDLTLAEILRSPFLGISEEALFELSYKRGKKTLWQRLREEPRYKKEYEFLSELLAKVDYFQPYELFMHILETCGGRKKLASRLGEEIDDPLNEFLSLAMEYGRTHSSSLEGFLHWLEQGSIEIKRDMEKGRNEIRILTVHGAKGLQAPIVFLPDTTRIPMREGGIFWEQGKIPVPLFSPSADYDDAVYRALKDKKRAEVEREYRRLLYVAMTRAEDELYICGWKGSKAIDSKCWYELVRLAVADWQHEGDKRVLISEQSTPALSKPSHEAVSASASLPTWINTDAPDEPTPARPLTPSRLQPVSDSLSPFASHARERGILVHRLLQYLPDVAPHERKEIMARFMTHYGAVITAEEKERIGEEVLAILENPDFAPVFGLDSVAEVSIAGVAGKGNPTIIAGRIDRIAVLPHAVYIIDYKTGRKVPENETQVEPAYLRQMEAYRQLVRGIYKDKTVYCALLWTTGPKLIVLSDALLESLAA